MFYTKHLQQFIAENKTSIRVEWFLQLHTYVCIRRRRCVLAGSVGAGELGALAAQLRAHVQVVVFLALTERTSRRHEAPP